MKEIIGFLPQVIFYFIPGAIFLSIFNFISNKKDKDYKYYIFKSIIVSYILNNLYFCIDIFKLNLATNINVLFILIMACVLAYLISILVESQFFDNVLKKLNIYRNLKTNFWNDVFDYKHGNYVGAYLKNEDLIYYGIMVKHDETDGKCFIMLKNYTVYDCDGNEMNKKDNSNERVVLFLDETSRIEIMYSPKKKG